jgi:hypothetical protein
MNLNDEVKINIPYSFSPEVGIVIPQSAQHKAAQYCGEEYWPQPWDQDKFVAKYRDKLLEWCKVSPEVAEIERLQEEYNKASNDLHKLREEEIERITGGLDRETVMGLAERLIGSSPYWPKFEHDKISVRSYSNLFVEWELGQNGWSKPVNIYSGNSPGSGYGRHAED